MEEMDEYEDVLVTLMLAVEQERLRPSKRKRYTEVIRESAKAIGKRMKHVNVSGVLIGISLSSNPLASLNKVVSEYSKVIEQIQENGYAVLSAN